MPPHSEGVARFLPSHKRISVLEDDDSKGTFILLMNIAGIAGGAPALSALTCDWKMIAAALCCRSRDPGCWMRRYVLGSASHETLAAVYLELGSQWSLHGVSLTHWARLRIIDRPNFFDAIQAFRHFYHLDLRLLQGRSRRSRTAVDDEEWSQLQTAAPPRIRLSRHVPWPGPLVHLVNPSPHRRRTHARAHTCIAVHPVCTVQLWVARPAAWLLLLPGRRAFYGRLRHCLRAAALHGVRRAQDRMHGVLAAATAAPGLGLTAATSAPGLSPPLPHLQRDLSVICRS